MCLIRNCARWQPGMCTTWTLCFYLVSTKRGFRKQGKPCYMYAGVYEVNKLAFISIYWAYDYYILAESHCSLKVVPIWQSRVEDTFKIPFCTVCLWTWLGRFNHGLTVCLFSLVSFVLLTLGCLGVLLNHSIIRLRVVFWWSFSWGIIFDLVAIYKSTKVLHGDLHLDIVMIDHTSHLYCEHCSPGIIDAYALFKCLYFCLVLCISVLTVSAILLIIPMAENIFKFLVLLPIGCNVELNFAIILTIKLLEKLVVLQKSWVCVTGWFIGK